MTLYTRTLAALVAVALALVAIVTPGPRAVDAQTSRYAVYAPSRTTLTTTGRDLAVASSTSSALSTLGGVPTSRTIAGTALSADITAATLRSGLSLPSSVAAPTSTSRLINLWADTIAQSDGTAVASWTDGTYTAAQGTGAAQPLYYGGAGGEGIGGRAVVRFDGSNDRLLIPGAAALDVSTLTLYVVMRGRYNSSAALPASATPLHRPYDLVATSPYTEWGFWVPNASQVEIRTDGTATGNVDLYGSPTASTWAYPHIYVISIGAGGSSLHIDGSRRATTATTSVTYNNAQLNVSIGATGSTAGGDYWLGDMAAVLLYSVKHTAAQRRAIEGYLAWYYSLPNVASSDT